MPSKLVAAPDGIQVHTPFNRTFVDELKFLVPASMRRWVKPYWIVHHLYAQDMADLIKRVFGEDVAVPGTIAPTGPEFRVLHVEYIGRCKGGVASGYCEGAWSVRLPETLLRTWFCDEVAPDGTEIATDNKSLYAVLGLKNFSEGSLIKPAYRRMAKQWHPDLCKEQDAKDRMQAITHAWEILGDNKLRCKYDCGLVFQARAERPTEQRYRHITESYRAPLRCGLICGWGMLNLGQFCLSQIISWDDIIDSTGRTMVSSWPLGANTFQIDWS